MNVKLQDSADRRVVERAPTNAQPRGGRLKLLALALGAVRECISPSALAPPSVLWRGAGVKDRWTWQLHFAAVESASIRRKYPKRMLPPFRVRRPVRGRHRRLIDAQQKRREKRLDPL